MNDQKPVPMLLFCPKCLQQHVDKVDHTSHIDWSMRPHVTHLCEYCQHRWMPEDYETVGVSAYPLKLLVELEGDFAKFLLYTKRLAEDEGSRAQPTDVFLDDQALFSGISFSPDLRERVKKLAAAAVATVVGGGGTPDDSGTQGCNG